MFVFRKIWRYFFEKPVLRFALLPYYRFMLSLLLIIAQNIKLNLLQILGDLLFTKHATIPCLFSVTVNLYC